MMLFTGLGSGYWWIRSEVAIGGFIIEVQYVSENYFAAFQLLTALPSLETLSKTIQGWIKK